MSNRPKGHNSRRRQPEISCTAGAVTGGGEAPGSAATAAGTPWAGAGSLGEGWGGGFRRGVVAETCVRAKRGVAHRAGIDAGRGVRHEAAMSVLPPCPHRPVPRVGLDWRTLHVHRATDRGAEFYGDCLEYGHALWQRGLAARAILCLDRALGAELRGDEAVLSQWPLPYAAMRWLIASTPPDVFVGNPRVHFQHFADRMNEPRRDQRRWRAWACWALVRAVRPEFPADPRHIVVEPTRDEITAALRAHGLPGEAEIWLAVVGV